MANALLIGNDINNLSPGYDWAQLLSGLVGFVGANGKIGDLSEQFPLLYEEICAYAVSNGTKTELQIKDYIGEHVQQLIPSEIHRDILNLGIREILTTNYEFTLEMSISGQQSAFKNQGKVTETRYSIFRNIQSGKSRFWHIHGDAHNPNSIALGYEHYAGYLQNMRNYVVTGTGDSYKNIHLDSITTKLRKSKNVEILSWLDVFFTHDIHIVGLGLDFVEIHLWWLLIYRARSGNSRKLFSTNKVFYYYPVQREDLDKAKLRFLRANNVIVLPCDRPNRDKTIYYKNVIRKIKKYIKSN